LRPDVDPKTVLDGLSLPVLLIDRDCVITKANRAAGVPLQVPAPSLVGRFCFAVTHGQKEPCWRQEAISCPAKEVFETGRQARSIHKHRWGERVVVEEIVASPLSGDDGEVSHVIAEFRNITKLLDLTEDFLAICGKCKKIRDQKGLWQDLDKYIHSRTGAGFSHAYCPDCFRRQYPNFTDEILGE
jgi:hypothetical protein